MSLATTTNFEVRTTGAADNGGGFDPVLGAGATDYSQQDAAQLSLSDGETSGASSADLISDTGGFTAAMVGNVLYLASGTNAVVGYYQITAYTDTNTVTLDRAPDDGNGGLTGDAVFKVGGAVDHPQRISDRITTSDDYCTTMWIKKGTYTWISGDYVFSESGRIKNIIGYNATHGDTPSQADCPLFDAEDGRSCVYLIPSVTFFYPVLKNIAVTRGLYGIDKNNGDIINCYMYDIVTGGFGMWAFHCFVKDCVVYDFDNVGISANFSTIVNCYVHDSSGFGFYLSYSSLIGCVSKNNSAGFGVTMSSCFGCIAYNNTVSAGFYGVDSLFSNCISYNNESGFQTANIFPEEIETIGFANSIINCIASNNTNYGFNLENTIYEDYNCYYNNGTGINFTGIGQLVSGVHDIATDPLFVNPAAGDFRLQVGSPCLNKGFPQSPLPGGEVI